MDQDWDAVAKAITDRMAELGMRQRDLADRADVGVSTVQELANNWKPRKRNPRTLAALSEAMGWHASKLQAVANGAPDEVPEKQGTSLAEHLQQALDAVRRLESSAGGRDLAALAGIHDAGKATPELQDLAQRLRAVEQRLADVESRLESS